jgi:hypothetical protein
MINLSVLGPNVPFTIEYWADMKAPRAMERKTVTIIAHSKAEADLRFFDEIRKDPEWGQVERIVYNGR